MIAPISHGLFVADQYCGIVFTVLKGRWYNRQEMTLKLKKVLFKESLIMLALLGGGSLIVIIDCLRFRYPVINTGSASLHYFPTILGEIGIIIFFLCPLYLLIRFIIWGIRKGLKRCALFCFAALFCLFCAGCTYVKHEVILISEAVSVKGLPKVYEGYTITAVPSCNDYYFTKPAEKDSSAESGYARAVLLKDNIYIVQIKYDNYPDYIIMLLKFTNDASGKSLNMVFSDTNIEPSQYGVSLKVNGFYGATLIGSRKNIMAFLRAYAKANLTDQPPALYKMKDKIIEATQGVREGK
jgi:hypothetical protein